MPKTLSLELTTLLATLTAYFLGRNDVRPLPSKHSWRTNNPTHYVMTNKGLLIQRPILALPQEFNTWLMLINCCVAKRVRHTWIMTHVSVEHIYPRILALPLRGSFEQDGRLQV